MATVSNDDVMRTADGVPLKVKLRRVERMRKVWAISLVAPLFLFLVVGFILPIIPCSRSRSRIRMLPMGFRGRSETFSEWDGEGFPPPEAMMTFAEELSTAGRGEFGRAAKRLNYEISGFKVDGQEDGTQLRGTCRSVARRDSRRIHRDRQALGGFRVLVRDQERFMRTIPTTTCSGLST